MAVSCTGGDYYNYKLVDRNNDADKPLFDWRDQFVKICADHNVKPSDACIKFGVSHPAIVGLALNTSKPEKIPANIELINEEIPEAFYHDMQQAGLINPGYRYV